MTPARVERYWPFAVAVVVTTLVGIGVWQFRVKPLPVSVPAATMTFGIVVSGFVATQRNMLLTMGGANVLRYAVRTGFYKDVLAYLAECIGTGLLVTGISITGFFLDRSILGWSIWLSLLSGAASLVVCLMVRNEILVFRMIQRFLEESQISR